MTERGGGSGWCGVHMCGRHHTCQASHAALSYHLCDGSECHQPSRPGARRVAHPHARSHQEADPTETPQDSRILR